MPTAAEQSDRAVDSPSREPRDHRGIGISEGIPQRGTALSDGAPLSAASDEARLLLACLRPGGDARATVAPLLRRTLNWPAILLAASRHRVRPTIYSALKSIGAADVPPVVMAELSAFAHANARRNLWLLSELLRLLDRFAAEHIPVAPFKGPILAATAFGNSALREAGDLDLLVHRQDILRAYRLLVSLGHHPIFPTATPTESDYLHKLSGDRHNTYLLSHSEHHLLREHGLLNVDLHWALAISDFHLKLSEADLWTWLTPRQFCGRSIQSFAPDELLLVLCINGAKDCWERLDRILDIANLLHRFPNLDFARLFPRARAIGTARMLSVGLRLATDLLGVALPPQTNDAIRHDPTIPGICDRITHTLFTPRTTSAETASLRRSLLHLRLRERLSDKLGYCLSHLRPGIGDWAALPLPPALRYLHYLTRPLRIAARYVFSPLS